MKKLLKIALVFISLNVAAQTNYLKGYFIDNNNQKIECLIKNSDWKNNPTEFDYKLNENESSMTKIINEVKEFAIIDNSKYLRVTVDIDKSSDNDQNYTTTKEPIFETKTVFLKILVEGSNSLYVYVNNDVPTRFFYNNKALPIQQLIYKKYYNFIEGMNQVNTNSYYRRQLLADVKCGKDNGDDINIINHLDYNQSDMIEYFMKTNNCQGDLDSKQVSLNKKTLVNYNIVASLNNSSLNIDFYDGNLQGKIDMGKNTNISFGFEVEIVLPYNNNSWSVYTQPTYNTFEGSTLRYNPSLIYPYTNVSTVFNYIQIPLGGRKYFYLNKSSKLYLDIAFNLKFSNSSSKITIDRSNDYEINGSFYNYEFGIGYQYKKINFEFRYYTTTNINPNYLSTDLYNYNNSSITLKYRLF